MSDESQDAITVKDFQQEVAKYWESIEGVIVDKMADGGLILCGTKAGVLELTPDMVQDSWLALKTERFAVLLHIMTGRFMQQYAMLTDEQRVKRFADIELYAHMARYHLEE